MTFEARTVLARRYPGMMVLLKTRRIVVSTDDNFFTKEANAAWVVGQRELFDAVWPCLKTTEDRLGERDCWHRLDLASILNRRDKDPLCVVA